MLSLQPLFYALQIKKPVNNDETVKQFWDRSLDRFTEMIKSMLIIKGAMRASRHYYEIVWPVPGDDWDSDTMHEAFPKLDPKVVKFAITPIIWGREAAEGGERYVASPGSIWPKVKGGSGVGSALNMGD